MKAAKDRIIVLRTYKHGESDLIVHGLNPQGARLSLMARGAFRSKRRFGGGILEPTHYLQITYTHGRSGSEESLHVLQEASLLKAFTQLRSHYDRLELALHMLQLVHTLSREGVVDSSDVFDLLGNGLQAAETSAELALLRVQFEVKLLYMQGVLPADLDLGAWLKTPLASHAEVQVPGSQVKLVQARVHETLRHYLGR